MKVIIVSDIKGESNSIIPYGLNLAKHLQSEVEIIHSIDSRTQQGIQGPYADSKSITPGNKLSQDEIVKREKKVVQMALDKLLSLEASKLNYPLKINIVIEPNTIKGSINMAFKKDAKSIILANSEADNYIFNSQSEILETFDKIDTSVILAPSGMVFKEISKVLLITDFNTKKGFEKLSDKTFFLNDFDNIILNAVDVSDSENYLEKESERKAWLQAGGSSISNTAVKAEILRDDDYFVTLNKYIQQMKPNLILPFIPKSGLLSGHPQKKLVKYLIDNIKLPIIYS